MGDERDAQPTSGDDQPRCPVHWDGGTRDGVNETARRNATWSHVDAAHAEAMAQRAVEQRASDRNVEAINTEFVSRVGRKLGYGHPLSDKTGTLEFTWTPEAEARLAQVPEFCREMTRWRVEWTAHKKNLGAIITPEVMDTKFDMWGDASRAIEERHENTIPWTDSARARLERIPEFVRGQVVQAVEGNAQRHSAPCVDDALFDDTVGRWAASGDFHEGKFGFR